MLATNNSMSSDNEISSFLHASVNDDDEIDVNPKRSMQHRKIIGNHQFQIWIVGERHGVTAV